MKPALTGLSKEAVGVKRRIIGVSDYPRPYRVQSEHRAHLGDKRRENSVERSGGGRGLVLIIIFSNLFSARITQVWQIPRLV